jgi:hypothetical protein
MPLQAASRLLDQANTWSDEREPHGAAALLTLVTGEGAGPLGTPRSRTTPNVLAASEGAALKIIYFEALSYSAK